MRGIFRGNIVVSNLPEAFGDEDLAALFDPYGLVLGARIDRDHPDPIQARRGVVVLAPADRVEAAVTAMNGYRIDAYKLKVRKLPDPPKPEPKVPPRPRPPRAEASVVVVRQRLAPRRFVAPPPSES
jgi:RNA recognition motif-containing protein